MSVPEEEVEVDVDDVVESPNDGPSHEVVVRSLQGFVTAHFEVKLFVLEKSGCPSRLCTALKFFAKEQQAACGISRQKPRFDVKSAA